MSSIVDRFTSHIYQAITTGISAYALDILTTAGIPTYKKPPSRNRAEYVVEGQGSVIQLTNIVLVFTNACLVRCISVSHDRILLYVLPQVWNTDGRRED